MNTCSVGVAGKERQGVPRGKTRKNQFFFSLLFSYAPRRSGRRSSRQRTIPQRDHDGGPKRLHDITARAIEDDWIPDREEAGCSERYLRKLMATGTAVYKYAQRHDLTERNPFKLAERPRSNDSTGDDGLQEIDADTVLTREECTQLIAAASPGLYQTFLLTAVLTGARVGELTALQWPDIDLEAATLTIQRAVTWARPRGSTGPVVPQYRPPKTKKSRRNLPLSAPLVTALRRWKLQCPPSPDGLVFPAFSGGPIHRGQILRQGLQPALRRAGLTKPVTPHGLRHSFASGLARDGRTPAEVATLLGHASPAITLAVYTHWFQNVESTAMDAWAAAVVGGGDR